MTRWYTEKKKEHFYNLAKHEGYRARSAYKLEEIQKRFSIMQPGNTILDLGAAPGGWSQIAQELVGNQGLVIGIDLQDIKPVEHIIFLKGDMTLDETHILLKKTLNGKPVDVVLSDMSPDISGNYNMDHARSIYLCEIALKQALHFIHPNGRFVCKLFDGEQTKEFLKKVQNNFSIVNQFSPKSSRKSSSEIYIIAKSFKNKSYIDETEQKDIGKDIFKEQ